MINKKKLTACFQALETLAEFDLNEIENAVVLNHFPLPDLEQEKRENLMHIIDSYYLFENGSEHIQSILDDWYETETVVLKKTEKIAIDFQAEYVTNKCYVSYGKLYDLSLIHI